MSTEKFRNRVFESFSAKESKSLEPSHAQALSQIKLGRQVRSGSVPSQVLRVGQVVGEAIRWVVFRVNTGETSHKH